MRFPFIITWTLCLPTLCFAYGVDLQPLTIRHGIEGQISLDWPLKDKFRIYSSKYYDQDRRLAQEAEIDLSKKLRKFGTSGYSPREEIFFMLFYNTVDARDCKKDYLIQRVKLHKTSYDQQGNIINESNQYLVEVMKLKKDGRKRPDRHTKKYGLDGAYKRTLVAEIEVGCGSIPGKLSSRKWPYGSHKLYKLLQNYAVTTGLYSRINYRFSQTYSFSFEFSKNGKTSMTWPYFLK